MISMNDMIAAVRRDPKVGRATCTSIDECWTDDEVGQWLQEKFIDTEAGAVEEFRSMEGMLQGQEFEVRAAGGEEVLEHYYGTTDREEIQKKMVGGE